MTKDVRPCQCARCRVDRAGVAGPFTPAEFSRLGLSREVTSSSTDPIADDPAVEAAEQARDTARLAFDEVSAEWEQAIAAHRSAELLADDKYVYDEDDRPVGIRRGRGAPRARRAGRAGEGTTGAARPGVARRSRGDDAVRLAQYARPEERPHPQAVAAGHHRRAVRRDAESERRPTAGLVTLGAGVANLNRGSGTPRRRGEKSPLEGGRLPLGWTHTAATARGVAAVAGRSHLPRLRSPAAGGWSRYRSRPRRRAGVAVNGSAAATCAGARRARRTPHRGAASANRRESGSAGRRRRS